MKQLILFFLFPLVIHAQTTVVEFDTYHSDNSINHEIEYTNVLLEENTTYLINVIGTFSPWSSQTWANSTNCGLPEASPIYPSNNIESGKTSHDICYTFAGASPSVCQSNQTIPYISNTGILIKFSTDGGNSYHDITHFNSNMIYNQNHSYDFQVEGNGENLRIKMFDTYSSDNYGKLQISVTAKDTVATSITTTDIEEETLSLNIYPNPTKDKLSLDFSIDNFEGTIQIYDTTGKLIQMEKIQGDTTLDLQQFSSGIYFIRVLDKTQKTIMTQKFIKTSSPRV